MPFPSKRCQTCRARHVKCDENRPLCTQCLRAVRLCTWDEDDPDGLLFRDENDFASNRAKRRRGGARRPVPKSPPSQTAAGTVTVFRLTGRRPQSQAPQGVESTTPTPPLLTQPNESIELHALAKMVHCFLDTEQHLDADIWGFLHEYKADFFPLGSHSTFVPAVMAFALAHFGRTCHDTNAIAASRRYYSQALLNTRQAVQCESSALADEVALTAVLLAGYEDQLGNFDCKKLQSRGFSHLEGVTALIRAREQCGEITERSRSLNRFIRRRVIRASIYYGVPVRLSIQDGEIFNHQPVYDALYRCLVDLAMVRNKARLALQAILSSPPHERRLNLSKLLQHVEAVQDMDARLEAWRSQLPSDWQYEACNVSEAHYSYCLRSGAFYTPTYHIYADQDMHLIWNNYRAARLITLGLFTKMTSIHPSIRQALAQNKHYPLYLNSEIEAIMRMLVEDIAATIPFHLNTISDPPRTREELIQRTPAATAFHLTWPLVIVSATLQIPDHLRDWIKRILLLVSQIGGNASLALLAGMDLHTRVASQPQLWSDLSVKPAR